MNYNNILAAKLNLDLDYERIFQEMLACKDQWVYTPSKDSQLEDGLQKRTFLVADEQIYKDSDYVVVDKNADLSTREGYEKSVKIVTNKFRGPDIFYLRINEKSIYEAESYRQSKRRGLEGWKWRDDLVDKIPYFIEVVEKIFTKISLIRVFVMNDTFLVTHRDYVSDQSRFYDMDYYCTEYEKVLGLSIIPSTGNVPMKIWSRQDQKVVDVPGNAMLFNDSVFHGIPITEGYRITIRIFGELDYSQFDGKLDPEHSYFLEPEGE